MNASKLVNSIGDWLVSRTATQWKIAALVAFVGMAGAFIVRHDTEQRENGAQALRDSLAAATSVRLHRQKDSIGARIDTQTVTLTKTLKRVDTLWASLPLDPVTAADTARVLDALPVLRRSTDSAIHACSEYVVSCADFRRISDSLLRATEADRDGWRRQFESAKPTKRSRVVEWSIRLGIGYTAFRIGRSLR